MASYRKETKPLSLVQQRARQFEALATTSQVKSKECNWWLADFQNSKDNPCECEPCENLNKIDEGDLDSQKSVNDKENLDEEIVDEENIHDVQLDDNVDQQDQYDEPVYVAKESTRNDEKPCTNEKDDKDDDYTLSDLPTNIKIIEAVNTYVHFHDTISSNHSTQIVHLNDEETHVTDE